VAARRRAVERAALRRTRIDRAVGGVLVVVVAAGLMSVLPGSSQRAVSRTTCRVATLGLGTCGDPGLDLTDVALAPPRCLTLAALDEALPEVRVRRLLAARGLVVTISTARSGDVVAQLGDAPQPPPPRVLAGEARPQRRVIDAVDVPAQAEWYLPRGQGLEELVGSVQDAEHQVVQQRSALGLLGVVLDRDERMVPEPTLLTSSLDLSQPQWPRVQQQEQPRPPRSGSGGAPARVPDRSGSSVSVGSDRAAVSVFNRISRESALVVPLSGSLGGQAASGTMRVVRDPTGTVVSVLLAVVTPGQAVPGEPTTTLPGPAVAYVQVPVRTVTERDLVAGWLAGSGAAVVPLDGLLGLRAPQADDQLESFLTRAATVTVLRYGRVDPAELAARVDTELRDGRRRDWDGARLVEAGQVEPTSSGSGRRFVVDQACRT
jgi:hypothetical protein